jgi:plasmid stability protein
MANLTIVVDDRLLRRARIRALEDGTSVNAVLRDYLAAYVGDTGTREALATYASLAEAAVASSGPNGRTWTRDDAHER